MTNRPVHPISILGLPGSGKTTFLAALWHLVRSGEIDTKLRFGDLKAGNFDHLNQIASRWRQALEQDRTQIGGMRTVSMDLVATDMGIVRLTFPDVPGEDYQRMWENREVSLNLVDVLSTGNIMLLINGNRIDYPRWVYDDVELCNKLRIAYAPGQQVDWHPGLAPTQVQLVELLQSLRAPPLDCGPRRIAVMVSAWDKAAGEKKLPAPFLEEKLPLLHQYLSSGRDQWIWRVYGVSAQGGEYDSAEQDAKLKSEAETLREQDVPSERIKLVSDNAESHDLTEPLEWLMQ